MGESRLQEEADVLRYVVAGTASETGTEFFRALVKNLAGALGTVGAWVTEYVPEKRKLKALAMWLQNRYVDDYEYFIEGTACQQVVEERSIVHIPERLIELFPHDGDLAPLNAVSYLGAPLLNVDGSVIGHLSVLDNKPMPRDERAISLFQIFVARANAEHRRLKVEEEVLFREEQVSALIETALDAILVLNGELKVVRINRAATRLFGCSAEGILDKRITDFLVEDSAAHVEKSAALLQNKPAGQQQLWFPHKFVARRRDNSVFPAEATLSRFENRGLAFFTVILRNVDERLEAERQIQLLTMEAEYLREAVTGVPCHGNLLGRSDCMQAVFEAIKQVAPTNTTVLITGETGTGKELVARSIHAASQRAQGPLVVVNCAAIPANLVESELFGHERGAFTGAVARRQGRFLLASNGTIFLDEIGELPLDIQAKLLRVLQEGECEPLGGTRTLKLNVRVIAATNRDLKQLTTEGRFREDLFFRLNVFPIPLPPLRERGQDVELLAAAFVQKFSARMGKRVADLTEPQCKCLRSYDWPGNVRELQNVIERAMILTTGSELQLERALAGFASPQNKTLARSMDSSDDEKRILTVREIEQLERANLERALGVCGGRISGKSGAARLVGIPASTFSSRLKALRIQRCAT